MIYIKHPISFTVTEWPLSPGASNFIFNNRSEMQNTGRLLNYIGRELVKARQPLIAKVPFTLLNAHAPMANTSFGFNNKPRDVLFGRFPLVFTFALTRYKHSDEVAPRYVRKPSRYSRIWGPTMFRRSDYLTVRLSPEILSECKIYNLGLPNMRYLYFAVGAFTKNLVRSPRWTYYFDTPRVETFNSFNMPVSDMVRRHPYDMWAFNREVWNRASNLIVEEHFSPELMLFYMMNSDLKPAYGDILSIFGRGAYLHKTVDTGLKSLIKRLDSSPTYTVQEQCVLYAFSKALDLFIDVNAFVPSLHSVHNLLRTKKESVMTLLKDSDFSYKMSIQERALFSKIKEELK